MSDENTSHGIRAAVVAYVLWGLLTIYWKQLAELDPFELITWRILCATAVMAVIITIGGRWTVLMAAASDRRLVLRLLVAALLLTANWTSYVWAVSSGHVIEAALGYFMAPLATMLLGVTVLHERATPLLKCAMALAALAVVVLTFSYGRPPVVAVIIAASWSLYALFKRQISLTPIESLAGETFLLAVPAAIVAVVMSGHGGSIPGSADGRQWALVAFSGVVTAVPLLLFSYAAQRVPFTLLGALQYLVPTINLALGWFVYDESMPADRVVGFALVWTALAAVTVDQVRRSGADRRARAAALTPVVPG
ncbi:MAG: EamA family transporter RarD [Ilumatobacteraceae bacterium]